MLGSGEPRVWGGPGVVKNFFDSGLEFCGEHYMRTQIGVGVSETEGLKESPGVNFFLDFGLTFCGEHYLRPQIGVGGQGGESLTRGIRGSDFFSILVQKFVGNTI